MLPPNKLLPVGLPKRLPPVLPPNRLPPWNIEDDPVDAVEGNLNPLWNNDPDWFEEPPNRDVPAPTVALFETLKRLPPAEDCTSDFTSASFLSDGFFLGDTVLIEPACNPPDNCSLPCDYLSCTDYIDRFTFTILQCIHILIKSSYFRWAIDS